MMPEFYKEALEHYGIEAQKGMLIEECAELVADIQRHKRGRIPVEALAGETADVIVVLNQLTHARPLEWEYYPKPGSLEQARGYLLKAAEKAEDDLGNALSLAFRATGFIGELAGAGHVEGQVKAKTERLKQRMEHE